MVSAAASQEGCGFKPQVGDFCFSWHGLLMFAWIFLQDNPKKHACLGFQAQASHEKEIYLTGLPEQLTNKQKKSKKNKSKKILFTRCKLCASFHPEENVEKHLVLTTTANQRSTESHQSLHLTPKGEVLQNALHLLL